VLVAKSAAEALELAESYGDGIHLLVMTSTVPGAEDAVGFLERMRPLREQMQVIVVGEPGEERWVSRLPEGPEPGWVGGPQPAEILERARDLLDVVPESR
jgi:hypothetical protein